MLLESLGRLLVVADAVDVGVAEELSWFRRLTLLPELSPPHIVIVSERSASRGGGHL